jgi:hypothetical protein
LRSGQANWRGKRPSWAIARELSVTISVQPLSAPMPETTATAAMNVPAHGVPGNIARNASTKGEPVLTSVSCGTRPITAPLTSRYSSALAAVPIIDARPTLRRGSVTRLAVMAAASTPMNENNATPAAIPIAE